MCAAHVNIRVNSKYQAGLKSGTYRSKTAKTLFGVALGMGLFPGPGGAYDFFERRMLSFPAQHGLEFFFAGDQDGGVAGAAGGEAAGDFFAGDAFGGFDDFENGVAAGVADVESFAGDALDIF